MATIYYKLHACIFFSIILEQMLALLSSSSRVIYPAIKCECLFLNLYYSTSYGSIMLSDISFD